jgi:hypothetical protein
LILIFYYTLFKDKDKDKTKKALKEDKIAIEKAKKYI